MLYRPQNEEGQGLVEYALDPRTGRSCCNRCSDRSRSNHR